MFRRDYAGSANQNGANWRVTAAVLDSDNSTVYLFEVAPLPVAVDDTIHESPGAARLSLSTMNPVSSGEAIQFELDGVSATQGAIVLQIYDARGRRIASVPSSHGDAVVRTILWNGLDSNGGNVASGVYFARVRVGTKHTSTRFVVVR